MKDFDKEYTAVEYGLDDDGGVKRETYTVSREERAQTTHEFKIGGETFTYRLGVAPESILRWSKMSAGEIEGLTEEQALDIFDETVLAFLTEGQDDAWNQVRDPKATNPLTLGDLRALVRWLFEEQSGRPTTPPSDSSNGAGRGGTGTTSKAASSSPEVAASKK